MTKRESVEKMERGNGIGSAREERVERFLEKNPNTRKILISNRRTKEQMARVLESMGLSRESVARLLHLDT